MEEKNGELWASSTLSVCFIRDLERQNGLDLLKSAAFRGKRIIVMEPSETANHICVWMNIGAFIRELSKIVAYSSLFCCNKFYSVSTVLATSSMFLNALYSMFWKRNPCLGYRIIQNPDVIVTPRMRHLVRGCKVLLKTTNRGYDDSQFWVADLTVLEAGRMEETKGQLWAPSTLSMCFIRNLNRQSGLDVLTSAVFFGKRIIIMEPSETANHICIWINIGTFMRELSKIAALTSLFCCNKFFNISTVLATSSLLLNAVYSMLWKTDPCLGYRIIQQPSVLVTPWTKYSIRDYKVLLKTANGRDTSAQFWVAVATLVINSGRTLFLTL